MKVKNLAVLLSEVIREFGGEMKIVLWDRDTSGYYQMGVENFELQKEGGELRLSVGVNNFDDTAESEPDERPVPFSLKNTSAEFMASRKYEEDDLEAQQNPQKVIRRLMVELGFPMPEECSAIHGLYLISKALKHCRDAASKQNKSNENQN